MKALNKETAPKVQRPERIIQFGEGNFLRAFVAVSYTHLTLPTIA